MMISPKTRVYRWDPDLLPCEEDMEFRLTYAGPLLAHTDDGRKPERSLHIHKIRRAFHKQMKALWERHPVLNAKASSIVMLGGHQWPEFEHDGFRWRPLVTQENGLICKVDILLLRPGIPGQAIYDLDNRVKTLFDALRKAKSKAELGERTSAGLQVPAADENPFFVLLEDDSLITHLSVTTDMLLEDMPDVPVDQAARVVIDVTVRPYDTHKGAVQFA